MSIELVPLATATVGLAEPLVLPGTPSGTRVIVEILEFRWEGPRLDARLKGRAAADWLVVGPEGTGTIDVRSTLETHDGALVYLRYQGRLDLSQGPGTRPGYSAMLFETGDERYAWLNRILAVARGTVSGHTLIYEVCEVR